MFRYRSRRKTDITGKTTMKLLRGAPLPVTEVPAACINIRESEVMYDELTPNYFSLLENKPPGPFPINDLSFSCSTTIENPSTLWYQDSAGSRDRLVTGFISQYLFLPKGVGVNQRGEGFTKPTINLPSSYNLATMVAEAKAKTLNRYSSSEFAFREPIATIGHTLRTIKHPLQSIRRVISRFSKHRDRYPNRLVDDAKALADLWLGYSVNAGPNMGTINDTIAAYAKRNYERFETQKVFDAVVYVSPTLFSNVAQSPGFTGTVATQRSFHAKASAGIRFLNTNAESPNEMLGTSVRQLPGLVWELIPLSFMIDRLLNVKLFLDTSSAMMSGHMKIQTAWTITRTTSQYTRSIKNLAVPGSALPSPRDSPRLSESTFTYDRTVWSPSPFDVLPPLRAGGLTRSLSSTLDLVSLCLGRLSR